MEEATTTAAEESERRQGVALLEPIGQSDVSGEATLVLDPGANVLTVTLELEGVEEGANYTSQITPGCERGTGHIHKLNDLVGSAEGTAAGVTELSDVEAINLEGGWSVKVGRPPGGTPGGGPQACGEVSAP